MLLRVPPFAVGTEVKLNDGRRAVVVAPTPDRPCRPVVRALTGEDGRRVETSETMDLSLPAAAALFITHAMGEDVAACLYDVPPLPIESDEPVDSEADVAGGAKKAA
jgi:hypothetical protein